MHSVPNLEAYLDDLVASLRKTVPLAMRKWDEDAIHDARVATRRMKAALDALGSLFPPRLLKPFSKTLRKIRRRLGPLRDIDVLIGHLDALERFPSYAAGCGWMRRYLLNERQTLREVCSKKAPTSQILADLGAWWGLKDSASDINRAGPPLLLAALPARIDEFATRARQLHLAQQQGEHPAGDPHMLRIAGKALRYTLELTAAAGIGPEKRVLRQFKQLQDLLGLWHDLAVLSQRTMLAAIEEQVPYHDPALYSHLLRLSHAAWQRAGGRLARFSEIWQETGQAILEQLSALLPKPSAPESEVLP